MQAYASLTHCSQARWGCSDLSYLVMLAGTSSPAPRQATLPPPPTFDEELAGVCSHLASSSSLLPSWQLVDEELPVAGVLPRMHYPWELGAGDADTKALVLSSATGSHFA